MEVANVREILDTTIQCLTDLETELAAPIAAREGTRVRELLNSGLLQLSSLPERLRATEDPLLELVLPQVETLASASVHAATTIGEHDDFVLLPLYVFGARPFPIADIELLRSKVENQEQ